MLKLLFSVQVLLTFGPICLEGVIGNWGLFGESVGSQGFPTQVFDVCFCSDQSKGDRLCKRILTLTAKDKADILRVGLFHDTQAFQSKINGSASNDDFIYL